MRRIGIDVGGTNTDAVLLLDGDAVAAKIKSPTTADVMSGILDQSDAEPAGIDAVMIGTTHFTNAVVKGAGVCRRPAYRSSRKPFPGPFHRLPDDLRPHIKGAVFEIEGGHEYNGRRLVDLDESAIRDAGRTITGAGIRAASIAVVFSPLTGACEERVAAILLEECPDCSVILSHRIRRIELLERENAVLLNASLGPLAHHTTQAFRHALTCSGLEAKLYLTQNDGTVMLADQAQKYPVFSFALGQAVSAIVCPSRPGCSAVPASQRQIWPSAAARFSSPTICRVRARWCVSKTAMSPTQSVRSARRFRENAIRSSLACRAPTP